MKKIELLAPAGSKEAFTAAINAGANAVFMAGHKYGARAFAENFTEDDLKDAITYAHLRGVAVFIVVNTLTFDNEVEELLKYTDFLVQNNVDALIVQDIGLISLFCNRYPDTAIHASTQVNAHNINHIKFLKGLGVKRVILARETSLEVIKEIKEKIDIEIEVFIHGALCVSYSGNCLISSILNKRSGNRGACSYNCRLPYELVKDDLVVGSESYLMSTKDLMTIDNIDKLIEAGIDSLKIEGRMRKSEYVSQTVSAYREVIDAYYENKVFNTNELKDKLKRVFNREYTDGFMFDIVPKDLNNNFRPNHLGVFIGVVLDYQKGLAKIKLLEDLQNGDGFRIIGDHDYGNNVTYMEDLNKKIIKKASKDQIIYLEVKEQVKRGDKLHKTSDSLLEKNLQKYQTDKIQLVPLIGIVNAYNGDKLTLNIKDELGNTVEVKSDFKLEKADKRPVSKEQIKEAFDKTGGTPFYFQELIINTCNQAFIPLKLMNEIRREAIEKISLARIKNKEKKIIEVNDEKTRFAFDDREKLVARVHTLKQFKVAYELGVEEIYYDDVLNIKESMYPNSILREVKKRIYENSDDFKITKNSVISELGGLVDNPNKMDLIADDYINVTNIYAANLLFKNNVSRVTLSSELNREQIMEFSSNYYKKFGEFPNLEIVVMGRKDLMISKYCPIAKTFDQKPDCKLCYKNQYYLKNKEQQMPLLNDGNCNIRVIDYLPVSLLDYIEDLRKANIKTFRLDFTVETEEETRTIIKLFKEKLENVNSTKQYKFAHRTGRFIENQF